MRTEPRTRSQSTRLAWLEAHVRSAGLVVLVAAGFALPYGQRVGLALAVVGAVLLALGYESERRSRR
jgi:hypothetical protein